MSELPPQDQNAAIVDDESEEVLDPFKQFVAFILFDMVTLGLVFPFNLVYDVYLSLHFI